MSDNSFYSTVAVGTFLTILLLVALMAVFDNERYGRCLDACKSDVSCVSACGGRR